MNAAEPIRAPEGAVGWTARGGYLYERGDMPRRVVAGEMVLVVSADGMVRGVTEPALAAVLRLDGDMAEVVQRLAEVGETVAGVDTGAAGDVAELRTRMRSLAARVDRLEHGAA